MRSVLVFAAIFVTVGIAVAQDTRPQAATCADFRDMEAAYKSCTEVIEGGMPLNSAILAEAHLNRGVLLLQRRDFSRARVDLSRANQLMPNNFEPLHWLGALAQTEGDEARAIDHYTSALVLNPDAVGTRNNRALLFWATGQVERAIGDRDETIRRHPAHVTSYLNRAMERSALGQIKPAMMDFKTVYDLKPTVFVQRCLAAAILAVDRQNQGMSAAIPGECQAKRPGTK